MGKQAAPNIPTREEVISSVQAVRNELVRLKVGQIYLFGSFARNEGRSDSDLDFLVVFSEPVSLFDLVNVKNFLESVFHRQVDVVPRDSLRSELEENVMKDAVRAA